MHNCDLKYPQKQQHYTQCVPTMPNRHTFTIIDAHTGTTCTQRNLPSIPRVIHPEIAELGPFWYFTSHNRAGESNE